MKKTIILLMLASGICTAESVYKWKDRQGVIHYSAVFPKTVSQGHIKLDAGDIIYFKEHNPLDASTFPTNKNNLLMTSYCRKLTRNLEIINANDRIKIRHENGQYTELSDQQRKEKSVEISALLDQQCQGEN